jgi:hypothetical protein
MTEQDKAVVPSTMAEISKKGKRDVEDNKVNDASPQRGVRFPSIDSPSILYAALDDADTDFRLV